MLFLPLHRTLIFGFSLSSVSPSLLFYIGSLSIIVDKKTEKIFIAAEALCNSVFDIPDPKKGKNVEQVCGDNFYP